jgi:uncharacterized CHY-type Zn-finger protein
MVVDMADAKKCDFCGIFYQIKDKHSALEIYSKVNDDTKLVKYHFTLYRAVKHTYSDSEDELMDLCPTCQDFFQKSIEQRSNEIRRVKNGNDK